MKEERGLARARGKYEKTTETRRYGEFYFSVSPCLRGSKLYFAFKSDCRVANPPYFIACVQASIHESRLDAISE